MRRNNLVLELIMLEREKNKKDEYAKTVRVKEEPEEEAIFPDDYA